MEYWIDYRTEGMRGTNEVDGMVERATADIDGVLAPALDDNPMPCLPAQNGSTDHLPGVQAEQGMKATGFLHGSCTSSPHFHLTLHDTPG